MIRALGWVPPTPERDVRALLRAAPVSMSELLPEAAHYTDNTDLARVTDQMSLGACQSFAAKQAFQMELKREGLPEFEVAALAVYHWLRVRDGAAGADVGGGVGSAFEVMSDLGVPDERLWPYLVEKFAERPGPGVDRDAYDRKGSVGLNYVPVRGVGDAMVDLVERVLTSRRGVTFGVLVSEDFCSRPPSRIVMPPTSRDAIAGGHAMTIVGHDRRSSQSRDWWLRVQGSWDKFGDPTMPPGQFKMSYEYLLQASDLWYVLLANFLKNGAHR